MNEAIETETVTHISGLVAPGYEVVRDAFVQNFEQRLEIGACVSVYRHGEPVIDLWGGQTDPQGTRPWSKDTVTLVYSATKGATATLFNMMHQSGDLNLDRSVASYWPEFAAHGKSDFSIRDLLSHQVGLAALEHELSREELLDGTRVAAHLANQAPLWRPRTGLGYHALTFGWLTGELMRRITGRSLGNVFAEKIARPLGLDFWIGFPESHRRQFAPLVDGTPDPDELTKIAHPDVRAAVERLIITLSDPTTLFSRVLTTNQVLPTPHAQTWNDQSILEAEQPAANGVTNARALARMYASCLGEVDGVRLLNDEIVDAATNEQCSGEDAVLTSFSRFGTGYQLPQPAVPMLGPTSFGHAGAGGAIGFADRETGIGFGYVSNLLTASMANERRAGNLIAALKTAVEQQP